MHLSVVLLTLLLKLFNFPSIALAAKLNPGAAAINFNGNDQPKEMPVVTQMVSSPRGANVQGTTKGKVEGISAENIERKVEAKDGAILDSILSAPNLISTTYNEGLDRNIKIYGQTPAVKTVIGQGEVEEESLARGGPFSPKFSSFGVFRQIIPENVIEDLYRIRRKAAITDYPKNDKSRTLLLGMALAGAGLEGLNTVARGGYKVTKNAASYIGLLPSSDLGSQGVLNKMGKVAQSGFNTGLGLSGALGAALSSGFGNLGGNIGVNIGSNVGAGLSSGFSNGVGGSLGSNIGVNMGAGLSSGFDSGVGGLNIGGNVGIGVEGGLGGTQNQLTGSNI